MEGLLRRGQGPGMRRFAPGQYTPAGQPLQDGARGAASSRNPGTGSVPLPGQPSRACYHSLMSYRCVLFDLDGTLLDPLDDLTAAVNAARGELRLPPLVAEMVRDYVGDGMRVLLERSVPPEALEQAIPVFRRHYGAHLLDHTRLYPGVAEVVAALHAAGARLAVVTNKPQDFAERLVVGLGLRPHLDAVLGGREDIPRKPAPDLFLAALEKLGGDRAEALVVGDGRNDIRGARAGGMAVCGVLYGLGRPEEVRSLAPDYLISKPEELLKIAL
jgi:phosphoglycolate phosphatase